jgi:N-acetyl sugar amidotransferase
MDTTDPEIRFDGNGICNHCRAYDTIAAKYLFTGEEAKRKLNQIVDEIRKAGKDNEYDCLIGLSGGLDSSYLAYWANKLGLRPLAVHFDNGWNSEVAVRNIEKIVKKLGWSLYTYVVDWEEFKDLQLAFLRASVVDIEMVTDNANNAVLNKVANEKNIKYNLKGANVVTEALMARLWNYSKIDTRNIKAIHKRFGKKKLKTYPMIGPFKHKIYYPFIKKIRRVSILNYVPYIKKDAIAVLEEEFDWKIYGDKHCESIFTRFFQGYILPTKFSIDRRKAYLSNLICSGQMMRGDALNIMKNDPYTPEELQEEKEYVLSKLGLSEREFEEIMNLPIKSHWDYPSFQVLRTLWHKIANLLGVREVRQSSASSLK